MEAKPSKHRSKPPHELTNWLVYDIVPVPYVRQSKMHRWKPPTGVINYRQFRDICKLYDVQIADQVEVKFFLPMPPSWSLAQRNAFNLTAHQQTPDGDNLFKALADATRDEDKTIWSHSAKKFWYERGAIAIFNLWD